MAFSQSIKRGQAQISCNLCEVETKITSKCLDCDLLMCSKCKEKVHPKFKNAKAHQIVDIKEVGRHQVQPDLGKPDLTSVKCQEHTEQTCCLFCKSCDQLVCPPCIAKIHNGHELVSINEGYEIRVERLKERQENVSADLDELTRSELEIKEIQKTEHSKYQDVKRQINEHNTALKKAVDKYTDDLMKELDQKWTELQGKTEEERNKINKRIKTLEEQKLKINNLLTTNEVMSDVDKLFISIDSDTRDLKMTFDSIPVFIPGETSQYNFGLLNKPSAAVNITILKTFTTELARVDYISPVSDNSLWISCNKSPEQFQNIRTDGTNMKVISSYPVVVYGMTLTPSNDLLLATPGSTLQTISSGKLTDTKYTVAPLGLTAVHVTSQNKVIVGAWDCKDDVCVVVMDMNGKQEHKYKHDTNNEPLFRYVWRITSASNGNIFVIDEISDDVKRRVVVLGQNGDVVNIYKGHPDINSKEKPFRPRDIVCTSSDNVIVVNLDIHTLHILNNSGHLIKYYKVSDLGIIAPYSLAYTSSQTLYIGCTTAVGSTKKDAKLYEVNISGC